MSGGRNRVGSGRLRRAVFLVALLAILATGAGGAGGAAGSGLVGRKPAVVAQRSPSAAGDAALVLLADSYAARFNEVLDAARAVGADPVLAYPPAGFIAHVSPGAAGALLQNPAVRTLTRSLVDEATVPLDSPARDAVKAWNTVFQQAADPNVSRTPAASTPPDMGDDARTPPPTGNDGGGEPLRTPSNSQTSEFMAGNVAVSVVFVESNGGSGNCGPADPQTENWSQGRRDSVLSEISQGLDFWTARSLRPSLGFQIDNQGVRSTSCEPVSRPDSDQKLWIADVLAGYGLAATPTNFFSTARSFADGRRDALGTDWAYTIFVVDSLNDEDGRFSNSSFAYAYLNGPFMVMTYDNNGWGIGRMNLVTAHETGHIFGAVDEYGPCTAATVSGYLQVANASCNADGIATDVSMMGTGGEQESSSVDVSTSARGAIGWRNPAPGAGPGSVVDVVRTSTASITPYAPDPTTDTTPTHAAVAGNTAFPPGGSRQPVTISRVASVERNLDGGAFSSAGVVANDGQLGGESEAVMVTPPAAVGVGTHTFGVRAVNQFGHVSVAATDSLTITGGSAPANDLFANGLAITGTSGAALDGTNVGATKEAGEPNHAGNPGGGSVWFRWNAPIDGALVVDTVGSTFNTLLAVYAGNSANSLTFVAADDDDPAIGRNSRVKFTATAGVTYQIAVDGFGGERGRVDLHWRVQDASVNADFDGNGTSDVAVFRPSNGVWYVQGGSPNQVAWGASGDVPVPGDYDGNNTTDMAVFRPSNGVWYIRGGAPSEVAWGADGDIPVPGDYDGNGTTDLAVFRPSNGVWYIRGGAPSEVAWGVVGDIPVPGDYDGNGTTDLAIFRPSNGVWFIRGGTPGQVAWGAVGDIPVPGDYEGNGRTAIAVFRPSNGVWYVQGGASPAWGAAGDVPVPGDYDGNGSTDLAVFRPSSGVWFVRFGSSVAWGTTGDRSVALPGAIRGFFF